MAFHRRICQQVFPEGQHGRGFRPPADPRLDRPRGGKRRSAEVVVDNIYFGESRRRDSSEGSSYDSRSSYSSYEAPRSASPAPSSPFSDLDDGDGELPF